MTIRLKGSRSPNLPVGPVEYAQRYQEQLNNVLRLYFNELDNITNTVLGDSAGQYLTFPYVAASDTTNQYATANDTATIVKWNNLDAGGGFTLNVDNTATAQLSAVYKIDYSLELVNTDNLAHDVEVWLKLNGSNVARSGSKFSLPARKSSGASSYIVAYSSIVFGMNAGDSVGLWWATDKAYSTTGPVDGVYMLYRAAQTSPFSAPAIPSSIGSITYLSRLPT